MNGRVTRARRGRGRALGVPLVCLLTMIACDDGGTNPEEEAVPEAELTFVRFDPTLLANAQTSGSFWAVRGENRELTLRYAPTEPGEPGEDFLDFEVPGDALLRRPDGTLFQEGDSVFITVELAPDGRFLFRFEPSGLEFDPEKPAELEIDYEEALLDLNGDGVVDDRDAEVELLLRIWRQERAGEPWFALASAKIDDDRFEADITSFTGFALAF